MLTGEDFENIRKKYEEEAELRAQLIRENNARKHTPDWDLQSYLWHNEDQYQLDDIATILASIPGHNDEAHWHWLLQLKDGRYAYTEAWCDETGWDCVSGGESFLEADVLKVIDQVKDIDTLANLIRQLRGEQPLGTKLIPHEEIDEKTGETYMYYQVFDFDGPRLLS